RRGEVVLVDWPFSDRTVSPPRKSSGPVQVHRHATTGIPTIRRVHAAPRPRGQVDPAEGGGFVRKAGRPARRGSLVVGGAQRRRRAWCYGVLPHLEGLRPGARFS